MTQRGIQLSIAIGLIMGVAVIESGYVGYKNGFNEGMTKGYVEGVSWSTNYVRGEFPNIINSTSSTVRKDSTYCVMQSESWIEKGSICHSDPMQRMHVD
jgi:hypothetical protein